MLNAANTALYNFLSRQNYINCLRLVEGDVYVIRWQTFIILLGKPPDIIKASIRIPGFLCKRWRQLNCVGPPIFNIVSYLILIILKRNLIIIIFNCYIIIIYPCVKNLNN